MTLSEKDQIYHWHPYTQHKTTALLPAIVKGKGALLWDENGKEYIDGIASWWVNPFGHSNPVLAEAIYKQLTTLEHVLFGGFTHAPAVELAEKLFEILPDNQKKIFYSDNGSTAVEVALKAALQYFHNKGEPRSGVISFEDAFHGDTFGAMVASGISFFTQAFPNQFPKVSRIPVPVVGQEQLALEQLEQLLKTNHFAAFIYEPLVQGAAGMVMYEASVLDKMITLCRNYGVLTIADEVMTGFGKTGTTFASEQVQQQPDMMCLSKALTGGTIPMAITTFTLDVFEAFWSEDVNKALFHGHTFTANPTGCAAALASLKLLQTDEMQNNIHRVHRRHKAFQQQLESHSKAINVRVKGVILAFEVNLDGQHDYYGKLRNQLYDFFISEGVILRPVGKTIYILPPYIIEDIQLEKIYQTVLKALDRV